MKKMLILLAAFTLTAGAASAQTPAAQPAPVRAQKAKKSPEQRAEARTKQLSKSLNLSPDQTAKVRQLALAQTQEMQAIRAKNAANRQEAKALRARHDDQLKAVLTTEQYAQYDQQRTERMTKRKDKMKARG